MGAAAGEWDDVVDGREELPPADVRLGHFPVGVVGEIVRQECCNNVQSARVEQAHAAVAINEAVAEKEAHGVCFREAWAGRRGFCDGIEWVTLVEAAARIVELVCGEKSADVGEQC